MNQKKLINEIDSPIAPPPKERTSSSRRSRTVPHAPNTGYDGHGKAMSDCGDTIEFYLTINNDDLIENVTCKIHGCNNTKVAAKAAGLLVKKQSLKEAFKRTDKELIDALAQLPEPNKHCADLAAKAMKEALQSAILSAKEPWRRLYRRH